VKETTKSLTLKLMSTIPGFMSSPNRKSGPDFIRNLCDQLEALQPGEARNLNDCLPNHHACGHHASLCAESLDDNRHSACRLCLINKTYESRSSLQKQVQFRKVRLEHRGKVFVVENDQKRPFLLPN
jgi:hypothetical protein